MRAFDRQSLEHALDHDSPLALDRVVAIVERFGAALSGGDGVPQDVRALMGTPRYAAPEQEPVDATADQFSLAAITYHLLTGRPPFASETVREAWPEPLRAYRPQLSIQLETIVFRGLARERRGRFPSLPDFVSAFRDAADLHAGRRARDETTMVSAVRRAAPEPQAGLGAPDETTTVSNVTSDLAEVLRWDRGGRSRFGAASPSPTNDESTVVSPSVAEEEAPTVISPGPSEQPAPPRTAAGIASGTVYTSHTRTLLLGRQESRRRTTTVAVAAGSLVLALGAVVLWCLSARQPPTSAAAAAHPSAPAAAPAPVAGPIAHPLPIPSPPPPAAPPPASAAPAATPSAPSAAPVAEPTSPAALPDRPGRLRARSHARPVPEDNRAAEPVGADAPKSCRISVASYPWSDVWIDGADTGLQTPIVNLALSCGRHRLEFKRKDLKVDQIETVTLSEGNELKRQYELKGLNLDD